MSFHSYCLTLPTIACYQPAGSQYLLQLARSYRFRMQRAPAVLLLEGQGMSFILSDGVRLTLSRRLVATTSADAFALSWSWLRSNRKEVQSRTESLSFRVYVYLINRTPFQGYVRPHVDVAILKRGEMSFHNRVCTP